MTEFAELLQRIRGLLDRFSANLKAQKEFEQYYDRLQQIEQVFSLPLENLNHKILKKVQNLAVEIRALAEASSSNQGPIYQLHQTWKAKMPEDERGVQFYNLLGPEARNSTLWINLNAAIDFLALLENKQCLLFFPDQGKKSQMEQVAKVARYINQNFPGRTLYLDVSGFAEERLSEMSRYFNPRYFFQPLRVEPLTRKA